MTVLSQLQTDNTYDSMEQLGEHKSTTSCLVRGVSQDSE